RTAYPSPRPCSRPFRTTAAECFLPSKPPAKYYRLFNLETGAPSSAAAAVISGLTLSASEASDFHPRSFNLTILTVNPHIIREAKNPGDRNDARSNEPLHRRAENRRGTERRIHLLHVVKQLPNVSRSVSSHKIHGSGSSRKHPQIRESTKPQRAFSV